ncbi:hypothetical protein [Frankia sp. ACN1ag]|uniref:hypothetical protein n=1 Tax=Frankia sp. ACN1ag TaxID=102891 RepID=UPI000ABC3FC3|nr:hypothetical protein [Frankia sp. ACN1ag]
MTQDAALGTVMAEVLTAYHRHTANAETHLTEATLHPDERVRAGDVDEDGEPLTPDHLTPAEHQAAAAIEAALAQAAATALAALATTRASLRTTHLDGAVVTPLTGERS